MDHDPGGIGEQLRHERRRVGLLGWARADEQQQRAAPRADGRDRRSQRSDGSSAQCRSSTTSSVGLRDAKFAASQ